MKKAALKRRAEEALSHDLQPERIAGSSAVTSNPSRWGAATLLAAAVALTAAGVANLVGPLPAGPFIPALAGGLGLGNQFLPRPMYVAVTDTRLICCRLSRLRGTLGRQVFAVPLTDLRILNYRSGKYGTSIRCDVPGRKPVLLRISRAWVKDFAEVDAVLARSGAFAKLDPPYPSAENFSSA